MHLIKWAQIHKRLCHKNICKSATRLFLVYISEQTLQEPGIQKAGGSLRGKVAKGPENEEIRDPWRQEGDVLTSHRRYRTGGDVDGGYERSTFHIYSQNNIQPSFGQLFSNVCMYQTHTTCSRLTRQNRKKPVTIWLCLPMLPCCGPIQCSQRPSLVHIGPPPPV